MTKSEEQFDIYDEQGTWLGTAPRSVVHARGLWHRSFHCWLARVDGEGRILVLIQRRVESKDTNPGCFDITVAGHLAAGETVQDATREMAEEIGYAIPFEQLILIGDVREEDEGIAQGLRYVDREISHVFAYVTDRTVESFTLQREELAGLYEAEAHALIGLIQGEREAVEATGVEYTQDGRLIEARRMITVDAFVPRDNQYYIGVFKALICLAAGEKPKPL